MFPDDDDDDDIPPPPPSSPPSPTIPPPQLSSDPCPEPQRRQQYAGRAQHAVDVVDLAVHQKSDARIVHGEHLGGGIRTAHAQRRVGEARTYPGPDFAVQDAGGIDVRRMTETADECEIAPIPEERWEDDGGGRRGQRRRRSR